LPGPGGVPILFLSGGGKPHRGAGACTLADRRAFTGGVPAGSHPVWHSLPCPLAPAGRRVQRAEGLCRGPGVSPTFTSVVGGGPCRTFTAALPPPGAGKPGSAEAAKPLCRGPGVSPRSYFSLLEEGREPPPAMSSVPRKRGVQRRRSLDSGSVPHSILSGWGAGTPRLSQGVEKRGVQRRRSPLPGAWGVSPT
jgi:hypothetical protein